MTVKDANGNIIVKDINGKIIRIGDEVYYARKHPYSAKGQLVIRTVTKITDKGTVILEKYRSTDPEDQIAIIKSVREKKFERLTEDK